MAKAASRLVMISSSISKIAMETNIPISANMQGMSPKVASLNDRKRMRTRSQTMMSAPNRE